MHIDDAILVQSFFVLFCVGLVLTVVLRVYYTHLRIK